jgi:hypothetical protein
MELLKVGRDKRALKLAKRKVRCMDGASQVECRHGGSIVGIGDGVLFGKLFSRVCAGEDHFFFFCQGGRCAC